MLQTVATRPKKFLVSIFQTSEGWKAESIMSSINSFDPFHIYPMFHIYTLWKLKKKTKNKQKTTKKPQKNRGRQWSKCDKVFKSGISKFFNGYLPQILLGPFLNTLSQVMEGSKSWRWEYNRCFQSNYFGKAWLLIVLSNFTHCNIKIVSSSSKEKLRVKQVRSARKDIIGNDSKEN